MALESEKVDVSKEKAKISPTPKEEALPFEFNLDIPFTSQAPHAIWDAVHEQTCEEAAVLMVARYFKKQKIDGPDDAEEELQKLIAWQKEKFGFFEDTTALETARILSEYYGLKTQILEKPTVQQIKKEVVAHHPVVAPANGRELKNPFFKQPGPIYHMLVIKGYTSDKFITNDPGTRKGADFVYKYDVLMEAIHDWTGEDASGPARVIVVQN
ncbi:C39 family peptidase [Candidatus Berkelbacteria bacterium]|nr:C39 family peptidase [Candidatus Berkelbacteria bacterium]